jgi:hypothetical protein
MSKKQMEVKGNKTNKNKIKTLFTYNGERHHRRMGYIGKLEMGKFFDATYIFRYNHGGNRYFDDEHVEDD